MGNKRNRRLRRVESQSPNVEENLSETSIVQGNANLTKVSENIDNVFDRNLGSELTEPSQISNEIEVISQRLAEQSNTKMSQIEKQLNSKFEKILKEIRVIKNCDTDDENCDPGSSSLGNKHLKKKHASNNKNRIQDNHFPSSDMDKLRQTTTPLGVVNETFDDTIIINENRGKPIITIIDLIEVPKLTIYYLLSKCKFTGAVKKRKSTGSLKKVPDLAN